MVKSVEEVSHSSVPLSQGWVLLHRPLALYTPATLSPIHSHMRALAQFVPFAWNALFWYLNKIGSLLSFRFLLKFHLIGDINDRPSQCRPTSHPLFLSYLPVSDIILFIYDLSLPINSIVPVSRTLIFNHFNFTAHIN